MFFTNSYEFEKCIERDCALCPLRAECIHYTPEEEYPPQEEYRLFNPLDDTSGELIRNVSKKISRLGYPEREIYKLVLAWYLLGYQVKDLLGLISKGVHPLEIEKIISDLLKDEFRVYLAELVEHGEYEVEDIEEDLDPDNPRWIEFLVRLRTRNFTGEVRLGPPKKNLRRSTFLLGFRKK